MNWQSAALMTLAISLSGCNSILHRSEKPMANRPEVVPTKAQMVVATTPVRMAIIWNEKVLRPVDQPAVRGFTGRIYFYDQRDEPVTVDGELTIYGYDDTQTGTHEVADRKYVFPADKFAGHYSQSELGHSYTVWVPWENYGGDRKALSLVPVFKLADNRLITGTTNRVSLSGRPPQNATLSQAEALKQVSQQVPRGNSLPENQSANQYPNQQSPIRRPADTFQLPQSLATRMQNLPTNWQHPTGNQRPNMDNPQINPQGDLYNQVHVRETTLANPDVQPTNQQQRGGTYSTFSDQRLLHRPQTNQEGQRYPVYGKPGAIR